MSFGTDQGNSANWIYVWDATSALSGNPGGVPEPTAAGYPNEQDNPNAAMPVYEVTGTPTDTPPYPNNQGAIAHASPPQGAMPVKFTSKPTAPFSTNPQNVNGAIPVYVVSQPANTPPYPNAQNNAQGAIPVYVVT